MFKKLFASLIFIIGIFSPVFVLAQTASSVTTQCWEKSQCIAIRKDLIADEKEAEEGFYGATTDEKAKEITRVCGGVKDGNQRDIGFCLPSSLTVTKISFGGRTEFAHIGEFIQYMYKYGVGVAGILGTVMIIFGGFQWATSGGNSAAIGSAKKKITGSIIGMLLAVVSYTILNTINPALVNLRVPGVFMINSMGLPPAYCDEVVKGKIGTSPNGPFDIPADSEKLTCGQKFFVEGTGNMKCEGRKCSSGFCSPVQVSGGDIIHNTACIANYDAVIKYQVSGMTSKIKGDAMPSSYVGGKIFSTLENNSDGWMYIGRGTNQANVIMACTKDDDTNKFRMSKSNSGQWSIKDHVFMKVDGGDKKTYKDIYVFYKLSNISLANTSKCDEGYKKNDITGFWLVHFLDFLGDAIEYPLFVTLDKQGKIMAGSYESIEGGYSYFEKSTTGYFEVDLTDAILNRLYNDTNK
ncbi:MAG TPA: pilin [Candidatus Magasanikbacteria bacterium]|nr:pilin [Candidatus Magasanikbacteria bacterium]